MRHKPNMNKHSTSNHNNPAHQKPSHMTYQYERPIGPTRPAKPSFVSKLKDRFNKKEMPATKEEVAQLRLNTQRAELQQRYKRVKQSKGSKVAELFGGEPVGRGRTRVREREDSGFFSSKGGGWSDFGNGPSLDFITGGNSKGRKSREPEFGQGLKDMF